MSKSAKVALVVFVVLILDQWLKVWIKLNFGYGEEVQLLGLDWARLHFVENPGMAFGLKLPGNLGKLLLSTFRIVAVGFLIYYVRLLIKSGAKTGLLICFGLILAGAIGNIIDSAFYGLLFTNTPYHGGGVAEFDPGNGYAGFLFGHVVDMLYFPMFRGTFPEWFPFWSGENFLFFRPVFNLADASITIGVIALILFYRDFFTEKPEPTPAPVAATQPIGAPGTTTLPEGGDLAGQTSKDAGPIDPV